MNDDIGTGLFHVLLPESRPMSVPPTPAHNPDFRRTDRLRGLVIVGLTFALCLVLSAWAKRRAAPVLSAPPAPPSSAGITGFPRAVDVVKTLPLARALTPRPLLRGIVADSVKSDGTVDLAAGGGRARYAFQSSAGEGPEPPREVGMLAQHTYCGRQNVILRKEGLSAELDSADATCSPKPSDPLPEPRCSMADIWAHAVSRGVPKERVAHIEYYRSNAGPAWRFDSSHARGRFVLYGDCKRELEGEEALSVQ